MAVANNGSIDGRVVRRRVRLALGAAINLAGLACLLVGATGGGPFAS